LFASIGDIARFVCEHWRYDKDKFPVALASSILFLLLLFVGARMNEFAKIEIDNFMHICFLSPFVMSQTDTCGQNPEDQKGLGLRLVLHIILNGIGKQQGCLKVHLRQDQSHQNQAIGHFTDGKQVGGNAQLGDTDRSGTNLGGAVDAEGDGETIQAHSAVALNRFEIIDNGNAQSGDGVKNGTDDIV
jgi:hypothetical protein